MRFLPEGSADLSDAQCLEWATMLYDAVSARGDTILRKSSKASWARSFFSLRKKVDVAVIDAVLRWYIRNMGREFVPMIRSGAAFKAKFRQARDAMQRDTENDGEAEEIDHRSKLLAERICNDHELPPEIAAQLPLIAHRSFRNAFRFSEVLEGYIQNSKNVRGVQFVARVLESNFNSLVEDWLLLLAAKFGRMDNFNGPVLNLVFRPDHLYFKESFWRRWSNEWTGSFYTMDALLEELTT